MLGLMKTKSNNLQDNICIFIYFFTLLQVATAALIIAAQANCHFWRFTDKVLEDKFEE